MPLQLEAKFPDPDKAYRAIIEAHRGMTDEQSAALNARLVLILSNQCGDLSVLEQALKLAREAE